ncbi:ADP-ribosylation factor-like protein 5B [Anopheles cruzii]|uniref:ADP-ribosylation factor-like protein 5B n=1 Tax=Anopheles cruzii TaxID=68878 RepID=UPI0022EC2AAA|nr:ADP-ribosylation factor-like protein 5B [Anopheles cruzii]
MSRTAKYPSQATGQREQKLVMVGLDNADKTTILYQFLMNEVVHTSDQIERGRGTHAVY